MHGGNVANGHAALASVGSGACPAQDTALWVDDGRQATTGALVDMMMMRRRVCWVVGAGVGG